MTSMCQGHRRSLVVPLLVTAILTFDGRLAVRRNVIMDSKKVGDFASIGDHFDIRSEAAAAVGGPLPIQATQVEDERHHQANPTVSQTLHSPAAQFQKDSGQETPDQQVALGTTADGTNTTSATDSKQDSFQVTMTLDVDMTKKGEGGMPEVTGVVKRVAPSDQGVGGGAPAATETAAPGSDQPHNVMDELDSEAPTGKKRAVSLSFTASNLTYLVLASEPQLLESLTKAIKSVVARKALAKPEHVAIALLPGSIVIRCTIAQNSSNVSAAGHRVCFESDSLALEIEAALTAYPGLDVVAEGSISVSVASECAVEEYVDPYYVEPKAAVAENDKTGDTDTSKWIAIWLVTAVLAFCAGIFCYCTNVR